MKTGPVGVQRNPQLLITSLYIMNRKFKLKLDIYVIIHSEETYNISNTVTTRKNCFRYLKLMSPLNVAICTTISYTLWVEWYYLKNNYLTLRSKSHLLLLSEACLDHNFFVFPDRSIIFGIWVHEHKAVCCIP
jgi:hypothetical protein